jgi:endo-1,4-beta-xylanase
MVTIQNHLKWVFYEDAHPAVDYVFQWADTNEIPVRGSCLFWPSYIHCPEWLKGLSPSVTYDSIISHVEQYCREYSGKVVQWDVINEAVTNTEIWEYTGIQVLADAYIKSKQEDTNALLIYNDYNLLINDSIKQVAVKDLVNQLIQMGAPIEGIGIQGHLYLLNLPTPANVLRNIDIMSELGLPVYITELDVSVDTFHFFQAEYFKDLLTALYSHPNVYGIIQWGFWAGSHWQPEAALYDTNWTPRPNGLVFDELMEETWVTNDTIYSDSTGLAQLHCFNGNFTVQGVYNGVSIYDSVYLRPFSHDTLNLTFNINSINPMSRAVNIVNVFPNPSHGQIIISTNIPFKNAIIVVTNTQGKVIITQPNYSGDTYNMDISQQPNGLYFLEIIDVDHTARFKIIKN